ncbi:hypothetical protein NL676_018393 [Syzygium grande]|nr:hypothetical protein NL676_018393 [Syzygium grande]
MCSILMKINSKDYWWSVRRLDANRRLWMKNSDGEASLICEWMEVFTLLPLGEWDHSVAFALDGVVTSPNAATEDSDPRPVIVESDFNEESIELEPEEEPEKAIPEPMKSNLEEESMGEEPEEEPMESDPEFASFDSNWEPSVL